MSSQKASAVFATLLKQYESGRLSKAEWLDAAVRSVPSGQIELCMSDLSDDCRKALKDHLATLPTTAAGWANYRVMTPVMLSKPTDVRDDDWKCEIERRAEDVRIKTRRGAEALRAYFHKLEAYD